MKDLVQNINNNTQQMNVTKICKCLSVRVLKTSAPANIGKKGLTYGFKDILSVCSLYFRQNGTSKTVYGQEVHDRLR